MAGKKPEPNPSKDGEQMPFVKCGSCGRQFSDRLSKCPFCNRDVADATTPAASGLSDTSFPEEPSVRPVLAPQISAQTIAKKYVNPIIVISVVVALGISFLGFKFYQNLQRQNASREFSSLVAAVSGKLIDLGSRSELVVDEINREWREAIFSEDKKRDFNAAIVEVRTTRARDISSIKELSDGIAADIKRMNPPEGKERDFQKA